ncbi:hypothetical protein [Deinococcus sp.]|uniref:hypothetical protein n=1 Tax=Deinococcus sp. TaxID=47478 RepID=UPI003CC64C97
MTSTFGTVTKVLLNELDSIAQENPEVMDTECRERLFDALFLSVIRPQVGSALPDDALPDNYGLYDAAGNARVRAALQKYALAAVSAASVEGLTTPAQRLAAFQDIVSDAGTSTDEYFGWLDPQGVNP